MQCTATSAPVLADVKYFDQNNQITRTSAVDVSAIFVFMSLDCGFFNSAGCNNLNFRKLLPCFWNLEGCGRFLLALLSPLKYCHLGRAFLVIFLLNRLFCVFINRCCSVFNELRGFCLVSQIWCSYFVFMGILGAHQTFSLFLHRKEPNSWLPFIDIFVFSAFYCRSVQNSQLRMTMSIRISKT